MSLRRRSDAASGPTNRPRRSSPTTGDGAGGAGWFP
jgi:hypothetical protein